MTVPLVSVLTPARNAALFVGDALKSVLAAETPLEVLVQDAVSTDDTAAIVQALGDARIMLVSEPDGGQADALNRALARASGEWILWLNADDLLSAHGLDAAAATLRSTAANLVYGDFSLVAADGSDIRTYRVPPAWSRDSLLYVGLRVFSGSIFFRREFLLRAGGFAPAWHYCMDYELLVRIAPAAKLEYVPYVIGTLRIHDASKTRSVPWQFFREYRRIQALYVPRTISARVRAARSRLVLAAYLVAAPLRYSRMWSKLRRRKVLW